MKAVIRIDKAGRLDAVIPDVERRPSVAPPVKRCADCHGLRPQREMVWDLGLDWWICEYHLPPRFNALCDWSEIDALCRERSMLLDRNDPLGPTGRTR